MINASQLTAICPGIKGQLAINISEKLDRLCPTCGINTPDIFHEFIANVLVESAEFTKFEENLNYSVAGLLGTFSRSRISEADAKRYGRIDGVRPANKEIIGNLLYGGEFGRTQLGNSKLGDGYFYRGSGAMHLTGYLIVAQFTHFYNRQTNKNISTTEMPELLRIDMEVAILSACWFFAIAKKLIDLAINDQFKEIVKRINGGYNGLEERTKYYIRAKAVIK